MNNMEPMEAEVVAALAAGEKITAIKLLREKRGLCLKEAKDLVDDYCRQHPDALANGSGAQLPLAGIILLGLAIAVVLYFTGVLGI